MPQQIGGCAHQGQLHVSYRGFFSRLLFFVFLAFFGFSQVITSVSQEPGKASEWSRPRDSSLDHASIAERRPTQPLAVTDRETPRPLSIRTGEETSGLHVSVPIGQETVSPSLSPRQETSERSQGCEAQESVRYVNACFSRETFLTFKRKEIILNIKLLLINIYI